MIFFAIFKNFSPFGQQKWVIVFCVNIEKKNGENLHTLNRIRIEKGRESGF
jgi:hypothetical protein